MKTVNQKDCIQCEQRRIGKAGEKFKKDDQKVKRKQQVHLDYEKIKKADFFIFAGTQKKLEKDEIKDLKRYVSEGGKVMIMCGEGGERKMGSNFNEFLEEFGIKINNNFVIRSNYHKYFHPKEALISNGVLKQDFIRVLEGEEKSMGGDREQIEDFDYLYPFGTTLQCQKPAVPVLSSGPVTYPSNQITLGLYSNDRKGKVFVLGSWEIFQDKYFDLENNQKVLDFILNENNDDLQIYQGEVVENETILTPNIEELAENLKNSLQQSENISNNFFNKFDMKMTKCDFDMLPRAIKLFKEMDVPHEQLQLIPPIFDTPMLGLTPSVFPPILMDLDSPKLELFDLDQEFANQEIKLAQLTNKSQNKDLDYYIKQSANILGLKDKVNINNPKEVLLHVMNSIIKFKMSV